jgi:hypothetical protein
MTADGTLMPEPAARSRPGRWAWRAGFVVVVVASVGGAYQVTDGAGVDLEPKGHVGDSEDVVPDTRWYDPMLSEDERRVTVRVGSSPPGRGPCAQNFAYEVVETGESVTIGFDEQPTIPPPSKNTSCNLSAEPQRVEVELEARLGGRDLYDGIDPEPIPVDRAVETIDVTVVPDGWSPDGEVMAATDDHHWVQAFREEGADWELEVAQSPAGENVTPVGGTSATAEPVTVRGIEGQRYTARQVATGASQWIVWTEGGLSITVYGRMLRAHEFTYGDELLEIAEGVRLSG